MSLNIEPEPKIVLQLMTRAILHDQLIVKIKSIYVGLVMLKVKCIEINKKYFIKAQEKSPSRQTKPNNKQ